MTISIVERVKVYIRGIKLRRIENQFEKFWKYSHSGYADLKEKLTEDEWRDLGIKIMVAFYAGAQFDRNDENYRYFLAREEQKEIRKDLPERLR